MDRLDYEIKLSTVESDDNVNEEKLKKTRHLRAKKDFNSDDYSESDSSEEEIKKTKLKKIFVPSTSQTKSSKINQDGINQERSNYEEINQQRSNQEAINQDKINQEANNHTMPSSNGTAKNHKKRPSSFQNNEDEINACDPSQRIMLKKMNRMGIVLESIQKNINSNFTAGNAFNESSFINKDADLEIFPISNEEDIATIEKKLERKEFKNKIESALRNCGKCATVSMTVNHFMDQVITYKTGMLYSFKGKNEKKKQFKSLQLYTIVANSVFKAYKECTIKNIDLCIGLWLAQCKNRFNRQENARQQLERDSRDMDVDLDSDEMEE